MPVRIHEPAPQDLQHWPEEEGPKEEGRKGEHEARETLRLIDANGPFPYKRDGIVFQNREGRLPDQPRGYYREYTVQTPAAKNRGKRRIVCGGPARAPEACYYTADHYASFRKIVP